MKYIIYTPGYDENIGGYIVLHKLCHELNKMGEEAFLWNTEKPPLNWKTPLYILYRILRYRNPFSNKNYNLRKDWTTPIAGYLDLMEAIVIYPEIVGDNPLKAKNVVRWFLNKPGFFNKSVNYGKDELYFYYAKAFNDETINPNSDNQLTLVSTMEDVYKTTNIGERKGSSYMLRKGKGREVVHDVENSVLLDGLSHEETAKIFNETEQFISYDLYTMYSNYAAMCGCISIVVPDPSVSKEQWKGSHGREKYGIAYGFDDEEIEYAKNTQHKIVDSISEIASKNHELLKRFVKVSKNKFYITENL